MAVWQGRVGIDTLDGRAIALDARSDKSDWSTQTSIDDTRFCTITGGPREFEGKVLIGTGGAEMGVRGYVWPLQLAPGDQWDCPATAQLMLADLP